MPNLAVSGRTAWILQPCSPALPPVPEIATSHWMGLTQRTVKRGATEACAWRYRNHLPKERPTRFGNPGQSVVFVIAPSVPAGATPPGNRAAIPITRPAFPCDWSAYLSLGLLVLPCTVVIALDGLRGLCALSDGRARAAKFIRNSGAGTAGPECSRTAVAARSIRTLGLQRVPSSRKSLVTCSIAAMPLASAASSSRKAGEWLAGAVAGSMPSPVAPTRK